MHPRGLWDKIRPREHINRAVGRFGVQLVPVGSLTYSQRMAFRGSHAGTDPDPRIADYINRHRDVLDDLRSRYDSLADVVGTSPLWGKSAVSSRDLLFFRGDNAYVWQHRDNNNPENYLLTYFYLRETDSLSLFDRLLEDGAFGAYTFPVGERTTNGLEILVSRDLLDSVSEMAFLANQLGIFSQRPVTVLDIGAGYGRLAHRMCSSGASVRRYLCTDAIAESTFLCDFYLRYRAVSNTAACVPLDRQMLLSQDDNIDLAINVHSFSECSRKSVAYWLSRCSELRIPYLFIVPNESAGGSTDMCLHTGGTFNDIVEHHGYRLVAHEPKYKNKEVQRYGVSPAYYFLFENRNFVSERQRGDERALS